MGVRGIPLSVEFSVEFSSVEFSVEFSFRGVLGEERLRISWTRGNWPQHARIADPHLKIVSS
jgi:hypothetical protein